MSRSTLGRCSCSKAGPDGPPLNLLGGKDRWHLDADGSPSLDLFQKVNLLKGER